MRRSALVRVLLAVTVVVGWVAVPTGWSVAAPVTAPDARTSPAAADPAASLTAEANALRPVFDRAAAEFDVPVELLHAIAFVGSRWRQLGPTTGEEHGHEHPPGTLQPSSYGLMGLRDDDWFGHSLRDAAAAIGATPAELTMRPEPNIRGAAALLAKYANGLTRADRPERWEPAVARLSGIPQRDVAQIHTYDVLNAIRLGRVSPDYRVAQRDVDLAAVYGARRLAELSGPTMTVQSADYPPGIWNPAASCNFGVGRSAAITHVAIHITEGSYAGAISWFKNCASGVSAHYVVRSSDGQVTQMVLESNTAWHVASHNSYSIGIEHEGFANNCGYYTQAMYDSSAALVRDISASRGISRDGAYDGCVGGDEIPPSSRWKIKGHTNFPTTKPCPGGCWDWHNYRNKVLNNCTVVGAIYGKWRELGGQCGQMRACTTNELPTPNGRGRYTHFQFGSIYWTSTTGAHAVWGDIRAKWESLGWENSRLGFPLTDEITTPDGRGRFNHFEGGSIYWTPQTGAHPVWGDIRAKWESMGWERSCLGYPTSDEIPTPTGVIQHFERGSISWTPGGGAVSSC
ncbi:MAG TPA: N-acetylmuramoyl-L-alanine amidase [Pseudonocardiaceae bacterium]